MSNFNHHIKPLTSIRFFAAFFVLLSHLDYLSHSNLSFFYVHEGFIGVTLFFILSGFVLSLSYQSKFSSKSIAISGFYFARIARIYPIHIITFLIAIVLFSVEQYNFRYYFYNATLIQAYIPDRKYYFTFNAPSWSLSVEMFFYLLFPFLIKLKNKTLILLALALIAIKIINPFESGDKTHAFMYIYPLFRLPDFVIGILLFRVRSNSIFESCQNYNSLYQIASILILFAFIKLSWAVDISYRYDIYYIIPMALIVYSFSFSNGIIGKCISNKIFVTLGEASFSLYMIHQLVIRYLLDISSKNEQLDWILPVSMIAISIILSIVMYKYVEIPLKKQTYNALCKLFPVNKKE